MACVDIMAAASTTNSRKPGPEPALNAAAEARCVKAIALAHTSTDPGLGRLNYYRTCLFHSTIKESAIMRYVTALVAAVSIGAAFSLYTPAASAAGVYVGVAVPVPAPVYGPAVVAPGYYYGYPYGYGPGYYYGHHFWGYRHAYFPHGYAGHAFVARGYAPHGR
jgi:hypothetical protein